MDALNKVIYIRQRKQNMDPYDAHRIVASMYDWRDVARKTEVIYDKVNLSVNLQDPERMERYMKFGYMVGPLYCLVLGLGRIILWLCNLLVPTKVMR